MRRLFLCGKRGKGDMRIHIFTHQNSGMRFYNGSKQSLFAGKLAVKGPRSYSSVIHDLPQRGSKKPFFRKLIQSSLLYSF